VIGRCRPQTPARWDRSAAPLVECRPPKETRSETALLRPCRASRCLSLDLKPKTDRWAPGGRGADIRIGWATPSDTPLLALAKPVGVQVVYLSERTAGVGPDREHRVGCLTSFPLAPDR
jgi:hypothetical protein